MKKRNAFTMVELVFVIVILGILAAIAVPRMSATRDDAQVAKGRSDVAAVRAAIISERQQRMLRGETGFVASLGTDFTGPDANHTLLMYPVKTGNGNGEWSSSDGLTFTYKVMDESNTFTYNPGPGTVNGVPAGAFMCTSGTYCDQLAQ